MAAITTVHFMIIFVLLEVALSQSTPDPPPPPRKRIPGGRSGGAKWVWCINKAKWEVGNPQNCKGVTDKAAFDAICSADWTDNFEGEGLWTWDPTANPPATYCKKLPSCFCELCSDRVSGEIEISEKNFLTQLDIGKEYSISLNFFIEEFGNFDHLGAKNILYMTKLTDDYLNINTEGTRIPALWILKSKELIIATQMGNANNYNFKLPKIEEKTWYKIKMMQKKYNNGKYIYTVWLNKKDSDLIKVHEVENLVPKVFEDVNVLAGGGAYEPANGKIRNLQIDQFTY